MVVQMCEALGVEFLNHYIVGKEKILFFSKEVNEFQKNISHGRTDRSYHGVFFYLMERSFCIKDTS